MKIKTIYNSISKAPLADELSDLNAPWIGDEVPSQLYGTICSNKLQVYSLELANLIGELITGLWSGHVHLIKLIKTRSHNCYVM